MAIFVTFHWQSVCLRTFSITNLTYHHHQPVHPQYRCHHRHIRLGDTDLYNLIMKKDLVQQSEIGQKLFSACRR